MRRSPFRIDGPAAISFSGGRTSGYMLWRILQAHGWKLPDDVHVLFANTGKEMPETLAFVQQCSDHWSVPIVWLEYAPGRKWRIVDQATAARNGEPYAQAIADRTFLPNPVMRFCTEALKIRPIAGYMQSLGCEDWINCVGLRADEPSRVAKMRGKNDGSTAPLAAAGLGLADVTAFWAAQSFDLGIPATHSNCDLCFLKGAGQIMSMIRQRPDRADWWIRQERMIGGTFRSDRPSYAEMRAAATAQTELFQFGDALSDCACTD